MSRTFFAGLALLGLAACSGGTKQPATGHRKAASAAAKSAAPRPTGTKSRTGRKTATRPDTSSERNPLTNH